MYFSKVHLASLSDRNASEREPGAFRINALERADNAKQVRSHSCVFRKVQQEVIGRELFLR